MRQAPHRKHRVKQFCCCCVCNPCCENVFSEPLPSYDRKEYTDIEEGDLITIVSFCQDKESRPESRIHALQPRQQDVLQEEGNRTCNTLLLYRKQILVLRIRIIMPQRKPSSPSLSFHLDSDSNYLLILQRCQY
jgi:hypothetical protein